jgi:hypothetical protein
MASAAGVMPGIRLAWARLAGRVAASFWRISVDNAVIAR